MSTPEAAEHWDYVPGLLELVDEGLEPADLAGRDFFEAQKRSVRTDYATMDAQERTRLDRVWDWLRGFRRAGTVVERLPVWAAIAEVWPVPGGSATFVYASGIEKEAQAELSVFAIGGFGGASRRTLTDEIRLEASTEGVAYDTRVHMTIHRYVHRTSGQELERIDVDAGGETGEFRARDLPPAARPFGDRSPTLDELRATHIVSDIGRYAEHAGTAEWVARDESLRSWQFNVGAPGILPTGPVQLSAQCRRTRAFEVTFRLPGGHDYAFCAVKGQTPVVPLSVRLAREA